LHRRKPKENIMSSSPRREARAAARRTDDGNAFLPDPLADGRSKPAGGTDSDFFAEEFLASATTGEPTNMDASDEVVEEEWGGPFLEVEAQDGEGESAIPEPPQLHQLPPNVR
jgi:hypothetical protein